MDRFTWDDGKLVEAEALVGQVTGVASHAYALLHTCKSRIERFGHLPEVQELQESADAMLAHVRAEDGIGVAAARIGGHAGIDWEGLLKGSPPIIR